MALEEWHKTTLGKVAVIRSGNTPPRSNADRYFAPHGVPWVKTMDLNNGLISTTSECITQLAVSEANCTVFPKGTVLVAMYGGLKQIGRTGLLAVDAAVNQAISALQIDRSVAVPKYVLYWLNANVMRWRRFAASSRKDPNITARDVHAFPIILPPISQQDKICAAIDAWEEGIESLTRQISAKRERKRGLMQVLLTGKKRFMEFHDLPRPKVSLGSQIDRIVGGGTPTRSEASYWDSTGIPWITVKDLKREVIWDTEEHISERGLRESSATLVPAGTVIVATRMAVGKSVRCQVPAAINQDLKALFPKTTLRSDYLHLVLQASQPSLEAIASGSTVKGIRLADLRGLTFDLPSVEEQAKISAVLSVAVKEVETLERQLEAYSLQKRGLMQQLLTGKKRVKVDNPEAVPA